MAQTTRANETNLQVAGVVIDRVTGDTLPGAHVRYQDINGQTQAVATDADGVYVITAPAGVTLVATFVGYTAAQDVADRTEVNFALSPGLDIPEVEIFGDAPAAPAAVVFGLGATLLALAASDRSNGQL